jgi:phosphotransferase system HPr (HPr) family protein
MQATAFFETRPAALIVQTASKYTSHVMVRVGDKTANAKSIMGVISLGVADGQTVTVITDGEDETQAIAALEQFFRPGETG